MKTARLKKHTAEPLETKTMLFHKYGTPLLKVSDIAQDYLGMNEQTAKRSAREGTLPIPAFRLSESNKAPWLVSIDHLAAYIDKRITLAQTDHQKLHA
ncbi:MAG: pyocin activator PrtN family protein [Thiomicrospira sp.]|jgi:hypothetical protein|nr:pyocin activator PrtN family protein [Thiomicrospira sp.]